MTRRLASLALAVLATVGCKDKAPPRLRDLATLPHVERPLGQVRAPKIPWAEDYQIDHARTCYQEALGKDPEQKGTITITAQRRGEAGNVDITSERSGNVSAALEACVAWAFRAPPRVAPGARESVTLALEVERRREPATPGESAYRQVTERLLGERPARIVSFEALHQPEWWINDGRSIGAECKAMLEFVKDGEDDWCGAIGGKHCRPPAECECSPVKRRRGDRVEVKGFLSFYEKSNGWVGRDERHYFGDVPREE